MHRAPPVLRVSLALLLSLSVAPSALLAQQDEPASVHIELEANRADVSYYLIERSEDPPTFCPSEYWRPDCYRTVERYRPLCVAPCAIDLAPTEVELGLSMRGARPIPAAPHLDLSADATLRADYTSRRRIRIAGGVIMAALVSFGLFNIIAGAWGDNDFYGNDDGGRNHLIIGFSSLAVGFGAGVAMVVQKDEVRIELRSPAG